MAIAGRVAIVPKGDWSADATYKRLDAVTYNNTLYFAKKEVPAGTATSNTEYWSKSIVGSVVTVDDALSSTSTNPVQNKVVTEYIDARKSSVGQNLITYPYYATEGSTNGITWTVNDDGTITADGTATNNSFFNLTNYIVEKWGTLHAGTYTIMDGVNLPIGGVTLQIESTSGKQYKNKTFTIEQDVVYKIFIYIPKGTVADNITFKPMLEIGSIAHMYQPTTLSNPTLKKKIESALQPESIVNNQVTTEAGYALDARQANPNLDGTLAKQISDLNGSLNDRLAVPLFTTTDTTTLSDIKNYINANMNTGLSYMQIFDEKCKFFNTSGNWLIIAFAQDQVNGCLLAVNHWSGEVKIISAYADSSGNKRFRISKVTITDTEDV